MHNWVTSRYTWNYHNDVNQLYCTIKEEVKKNIQYSVFILLDTVEWPLLLF